jgi:hypothetical protein
MLPNCICITDHFLNMFTSIFFCNNPLFIFGLHLTFFLAINLFLPFFFVDLYCFLSRILTLFKVTIHSNMTTVLLLHKTIFFFVETITLYRLIQTILVQIFYQKTGSRELSLRLLLLLWLIIIKKGFFTFDLFILSNFLEYFALQIIKFIFIVTYHRFFLDYFM